MPDSAARLSRGHVCHEAHGHGLAPGVILKHISRTDSPRDSIHLGLGERDSLFPLLAQSRENVLRSVANKATL